MFLFCVRTNCQWCRMRYINSSSDNLGLGTFLPWSLQWKTVSMEVQGILTISTHLWRRNTYGHCSGGETFIGLMLIWLGRGSFVCSRVTLFFFFSTDKPYKNDKISNVYSKEKLVTIALIFHYVSKPTFLVGISSHYLPRWI